MLPLSILNPISLKVGTSLIAEVSSAAGRQLTRRSPVCTSSPHLKTKAKKNKNANTITNKKTARRIRMCLHSWMGVRVHDRYTHSEVGPLLCLSRASGTIVSNALSDSIRYSKTEWAISNDECSHTSYLSVLVHHRII